MVHRLFIKHGITLSTRKLKSIFEDSILPDDILRFIEEDREWFEFFEDKVEFVDSTRNATGINKHIREWYYNNGKFINREGNIISLEDIRKNDEAINKSISHYELNDPDTFVLAIVDNINLLTPEKILGEQQTLFSAINKLSSDYFVKLRNRFGLSPVVIQQQTLGKEGNDSVKLDRTEPSADGLSDNKSTSKDCNVLMTIYSPFRNKQRTYLDYDITKLKDNYRRIAIDFDREGSACETSVYFNGATNFFKEMPEAKSMTEAHYKLIEENKVKP